ncbi:TetR/AcrR family transcriptional regulator [Mycobacterium sp. M1]|uniref:TetR/AcrR family transcriptional regulator n=2 Tax=Mycolicibacter acidiphilus TaxID=2835306 RepID=A0ABS5RGP0_9MYCO|nr:TetR/AcrR family transcriptional regulator [Mycolicibacter acidiphilus]
MPGQSESGGAVSAGGRRIRGLDADERRAQRRDQILVAAFELFARDGYANTAIEQICQTAYVGNKAFYELFESKEDCYLTLLAQIAERVEVAVAEAMGQAAPDEDERQILRRVLSAFAHTLADDPRVAVVAFGESAGVSPRVEGRRRENRRRTAEFLEALWRAHHPANDRTDYQALSVATVGGLFELVAESVHRPEPRPIDDLITDLTTFVLVVEAGIGQLGA